MKAFPFKGGDKVSIKQGRSHLRTEVKEVCRDSSPRLYRCSTHGTPNENLKWFKESDLMLDYAPRV